MKLYRRAYARSTTHDLGVARPSAASGVLDDDILRAAFRVSVVRVGERRPQREPQPARRERE
jgi:hypothetical protein